jgi:diacylglycerol kinase (ATP)
MPGERTYDGLPMAAGAARRVIRDATTKMKHVLGRSAYVWAAAKNLRTKPFQAQIEVDGSDWYEGQASLVLSATSAKRSPE